jgi:transcriptional regulator with XRE-family HTH domain
MAHPADVAVGKRLRSRREALRLSRDEVAAVLDVTVDQLERYEAGADRMRARDLFQAAKQLEVPVGYFFRDVTTAAVEEPGDTESSLMQQSLELLRAFSGIADAEVRAGLIRLAQRASAEATSGSAL